MRGLAWTMHLCQVLALCCPMAVCTFARYLHSTVQWLCVHLSLPGTCTLLAHGCVYLCHILAPLLSQFCVFIFARYLTHCCPMAVCTFARYLMHCYLMAVCTFARYLTHCYPMAVCTFARCLTHCCPMDAKTVIDDPVKPYMNHELIIFTVVIMINMLSWKQNE